MAAPENSNLYDLSIDGVDAHFENKKVYSIFNKS